MPNRLNAFLESNPSLRQLAEVMRQIEWLQLQYQSIAPPSLLRGSRVAQFTDQQLTLAADNGAIAGKLRQLTPELISSFRTRGCEVTGIQIRVQVNNRPPVPPAIQRHLGAQGRDALNTLAHDLPESPLRSAIERLARRAR